MTAHPTGGGAPKAGFGVTFLATIGGLVIATFAAYGIVKAMTGDAKSHHRPAAAAVVEPDPDPAPPPQRHAHARPRAPQHAPPRGVGRLPHPGPLVEGRVIQEFGTGQEYCNKYMRGLPFKGWVGSGPGRRALCNNFPQ